MTSLLNSKGMFIALFGIFFVMFVQKMRKEDQVDSVFQGRESLSDIPVPQ